jgi:thioredoxin reductase (NADPH)
LRSQVPRGAGALSGIVGLPFPPPGTDTHAVVSPDTSQVVAETPDRLGAFPRLEPDQVELLAGYGERRPTREGDILFREGEPRYDFFVVLSGLVAVVDDFGGDERLLSVHGPGRFLGELNLLTGQPVLATAVVREAGEVLAVPPERLRQVVTRDAGIGELLLRAFLVRRSLMIELGAGPRVIGSRYSADARRIRDFLARNRIPHTWLDLEDHGDAEHALRLLDVSVDETPIVIQGANVLRNPSNGDLAAMLGIRPLSVDERVVDLLVIGAGPAGLAASVYGSSEGLTTVLVDSVATGGQASTSSNIENYLGFPRGVSGGELAELAQMQARKFGTHIVVPAEAAALEREDGLEVVRFGDSRVAARCIVIATGARYRKLAVPRLEEYEGNGVYYAATLMEAKDCGTRPVVVGGGNSAGQATLFLADRAGWARILIRGGDLAKSMSRYLVDRIEADRRIEVVRHAEVRELLGEDGVEHVVVEDTRDQTRTTIDTSAVFVFIGADPCTAWIAGQLDVDRHGFLRTGPEATRPDGGDPLLLETSRPGIFAAGDVRSGSVKRVASAVGEGAMAVQLVHHHLAGRV